MQSNWDNFTLDCASVCKGQINLVSQSEFVTNLEDLLHCKHSLKYISRDMTRKASFFNFSLKTLTSVVRERPKLGACEIPEWASIYYRHCQVTWH